MGSPSQTLARTLQLSASPGVASLLQNVDERPAALFAIHAVQAAGTPIGM